jgi:L-arabinose isomerase
MWWMISQPTHPCPNCRSRALWLPRLNLNTDAAAWIYAGGAHHTSFSFSVTVEQSQDFVDMAGFEFLIIDGTNRIPEFRDKLRWNDLYYHLIKGTRHCYQN